MLVIIITLVFIYYDLKNIIPYVAKLTRIVHTIVTGTEALFADLGYFSIRSVQVQENIPLYSLFASMLTV